MDLQVAALKEIIHAFSLSAFRANTPAECSVLAGVFGGVAVYTFHDIHFTISGYVWLAIWYSFAVFEMVYVKKVVDTVEMTTWSRTYFQASCITTEFTIGHASICSMKLENKPR